jgi:hypothetical protein
MYLTLTSYALEICPVLLREEYRLKGSRKLRIIFGTQREKVTGD